MPQVQLPVKVEFSLDKVYVGGRVDKNLINVNTFEIGIGQLMEKTDIDKILIKMGYILCEIEVEEEDEKYWYFTCAYEK